MIDALWTYNRDRRKRPNVHPLRTPPGAVLTRDAPDDHPRHHALWFTITSVNGENLWEGGDGDLALRGRPDRTDTRLLLADGGVHERALGTPSTWCDLSGSADEGTGGMLILDHASDPSHPVPWYGSTRVDRCEAERGRWLHG